MRAGTEIWLTAICVWFLLRALDLLMPPENLSFNMMVVLIAVIACLANRLEDRNVQN